MVDNSPFFIIGAGRSGTTLLRLILAGHSRLHIPPETWFIRSLVQELPLTGALTPAQVGRAVRIMTEHYRWPDMDIAPETLHDWAAALHNPTLTDMTNLVYIHHMEKNRKQRFGDKTPIYYQIVPQLSVLYPDAKFIHLIRDGRDVAISFIDVEWDYYYEKDKFEWTDAMRARRAYLHSPLAGRILEVKYEDLVLDLEPTVRRICTFLGEQFEPAMLDWQQTMDLIPARERHIHRKLSQPVSADAVAIWKRKLTSAECFAMEACLHRDLRQLGYPVRFGGAGWRPLLDATGWLLQTGAPLVRRGFRYLKQHNLVSKTAYF